MPRLEFTDSMPEGPAVQALIETLRTVAAQAGGSLPRRNRTATLRGSTFAAVDELKCAGLSATEVLFAIEALAARAGISVASDTIDAVAAWCVQRYFSREPQHPPG